MNTDEPATYDLIDQPWLLVRRLDGSQDELSLLGVFEQGHLLAGLVGDVPTQVFALTRLLVAVLHRAVAGPRDLDHWEQLWNASELPCPDIRAYLTAHRARFDLLHPATPFLQVAGLHTAKGEVSELSKLIADVPNGRPFFSTRLGPVPSLSFAEAARWVVHCHAFDPSGIKSGAVGDPRVTGGKGYPIGTGWSGFLGGVMPEGATLRETLLLNLIACDFGDLAQWRDSDAPAWERTAVGAAEETPDGRAPTGPTDLYTWQSRRIRLEHDGAAVTGVLICNGERIAPQNKNIIEPHTGWRRSQAQEKKRRLPQVYMPREHNAERAIWRGLESLLPAARTVQGHDAAADLAPVVLEWISYVTEEVLGPDHVVQLRTLGMIYRNNSSVTDEIVDDALALRTVLLAHNAQHLVGVVLACVAAAEAAAWALGSLALDVAHASGQRPPKTPGRPEPHEIGPKTRAIELAFVELDGLFREWIARLGPAGDPTDEQAAWHRTVKQVIDVLAADVLAQAPMTAWVGRTVKGGQKRLVTSAQADLRFRRELRTAVPLAYPPQDKDTTNEPHGATASA
ncbi:MAG TPA: type I-E CRISPR-associated protein Cse1/CasA [Pseudonocardiaceae bacterium]|jgi:CRISPR system Cascade subunit CasA|nr:type I-E CRISPR-associated protein Cse1/CasA [Pseudonocardiaceae bacterium]